MEVTRFFFVLVLLFLVLPSGVMAETSKISDVSHYDVSVIEGMVIDQITIDAVPVGTNQTHHIYSGPQHYTLTVNSIADSFVGVNYHSKFELILSNGSYTESLMMDKYSPKHDYKLYIQMLDPSEESGLPNLLAINLYMGMNPLTARFELPPTFGSYTEIPITRVTGDIGKSTTVYVTQDTYEEWQKLVQGNVVVDWVTGAAGVVAGFVWEAVLKAINSIPFVGPHFVTMLTYAGMFLEEGGFWLPYFIFNLVGLFFAAQAFILMIACVETGFDAVKSVKAAVQHNVSIIRFLLWLFHFLCDLLTSILIAVGALK